MACRRSVVDQANTLLLLACITTLTPQTYVSSQSKPEKVAETTAQENCDLSCFSKNTEPQLKVGQTLTYRSSLKKGQSQSIRVESVDNKYVVEEEPIPFEQTILISNYVKYKDDSCYMIRQRGTIENVLYSLNPTTMEKSSEESAISYVSKTGKILYSESKTKIKSGNTESLSTNIQSGFQVLSSLHFFYGYWMLALRKDLRWECVKLDSKRELVGTFLTVKGIQSTNNRSCFVVEIQKQRQSAESITTTYWIDVKERIVVKVKRKDVEFSLVE